MSEKTILTGPEVRVMRPDDLEAVVEIDAKVFGQRRPEYYERKIAHALDKTQQLVTSLVIEVEGEVAGFIMGEVYLGEFGLPETTATIDTIGVDPIYQGRGMGAALFEEFVSHLRRVGVQSIITRVNWNDWGLLRFFERVGFSPANIMNLELVLE